MFSKILNLIYTDTGKDTGVVFIGTVINILVGGLFFIFAPRILGPADYGLFAVVMATGILSANLANFGMDSGILKFASIKDFEKPILNIALKSYLVFGLSVFILGFIFSGPIANLLGYPQISTLLKIAFAATILILISNFFVAALQAKKEFLKASIVGTCANTARILAFAIAAYFFTVDLYLLTVLFFGVTIVSVIVGKIFVPLDFLKVNHTSGQMADFFKYNFWIAAAVAIASIPLDNYMILKYAGAAATGLFAAPMKFLSSTYQFSGGFSRVLAPRFSSFDTNEKAKEFAKKAFLFSAIVFLGLIPAILFAPFLTVILGSEFRASVPIFQILAVGMAFFFADTVPITIVLYYFGKSKITFYVTVWHYFLYALMLIFLVPNHGAIGAAIAFTTAEITTFITLLVYVVYKLSEKTA